MRSATMAALVAALLVQTAPGGAEEAEPAEVLLFANQDNVLHIYDVTGEEVAAGVRALDPRYQPAIVVMSAYLAPDDVQRVLARGADAFLAKPFELGELRRIVLHHAGLPVA